MSDARYNVPTRLDAPIPFLMWELVDVLVATMILGTSMLINLFPLGVLGAILVLKLAKKLRQGQKQGQVQHLFWRIGIDMDKPLRKHTANPLILEYFE